MRVREEEAKIKRDMKREELAIIGKKSPRGETVGERKREGMQSCRWMEGEKSEHSEGAKRRRAKGGEASHR